MPMALQFESEFIFSVMFMRKKRFSSTDQMTRNENEQTKNHQNEQTKWAYHLNFVYFHLIGTYHVWKSNNDNDEHFKEIHITHPTYAWYRYLYIVHNYGINGTILHSFLHGVRNTNALNSEYQSQVVKPKVVSYNFLSLSSYHFRIWL